MKTLQISSDLTLPLDFMTKTAAVLAQRRKGKTYTASVLAEELVGAGQPFVALDPTGAWWGLRASADGQSAGLPVVILGGQHGDLPLERQAGRFVADLVLDKPGWYVLDFSLLGSRTAERDFATAFADRLYRRKMQPGMDFPLHLFVDEADMFVPQEKERDENAMLGAFQAIVRRGGLHGLGTTLISQRPALVNKNVLTQLDMLVLLRLVAGNDQDYVDKNYIKRAATPEQRAELMASMASLSLGEAWVWEPGAEPSLFERVRIRERRTFNSSATPKPGEQRVEPRRVADVDLAAIKEQMAETIERAKADDPKELRKRIAQLEKEAAARPTEQVVETLVERVEVPVLDPETAQAVHDVAMAMQTAAEGASDLADRLLEGTTMLKGALAEVSAAQHNQEARGRQDVPRARAAGSGGPAGRLEGGRTPQRPDPPARREPRRTPVPRAEAAAGDVDTSVVNEPRQKILDALAWYADVGVEPVSRSHLAFVAGTSPSSSGYEKNLGALRTAGLLDYPAGGMVALTDAGAALAQPAADIATTEELLDVLERRLGKPKGAILRVLVDVYPEALTREQLAELVDVSPQSSGFEKNIGSLRSLGLVEYPLKGSVAALPILFLGGR